MNNFPSLPFLQPGHVSGEFRLRDALIGETRAGRQYLRIFLEDMSISLPVYIWDEDLYRGVYLPNYSLARIEGESRYYYNQLRVDLFAIDPVGFKRAGEVIRLIPRSICPLPELLVDLQAAIDRITQPTLCYFVEAVFADDAVAFAFVSAPASLNNHHNYPGGLLKHSLECLQMVGKHRDFSKNSYQLGLVSALFHDIGKTLTLTHNMKRTSLGYSTDHDKLTYEVLKPYLSQLEQSWPAGAKDLFYLLGWKINRHVPRYNMADLVACSDRLSAGLDMEKKGLNDQYTNSAQSREGEKNGQYRDFW